MKARNDKKGKKIWFPNGLIAYLLDFDSHRTVVAAEDFVVDEGGFQSRAEGF